MSDEPRILDDEEPEVDNSWMATFTDLTLLLLVFFIFLVSFSTLEPSKFKESFGSIKGAMGGQGISAPDVQKKKDKEADKYEQVKMRKQFLEAQQQAFNEIRSFLVENGMEGKVGAVIENGEITLRLPALLLFEKHSENLAPGSEPMLDLLYQVFVRRREQSVDIRGFTDDTQPPPTSRLKDNWELSALRAVSVLRYLLDKGIEPTRMTATGFGPLEPIMMNTTEENRARNRRVEFVLRKHVSSSNK